jgi:hypothetical protein
MVGNTLEQGLLSAQAQQLAEEEQLGSFVKSYQSYLVGYTIGERVRFAVGCVLLGCMLVSLIGPGNPGGIALVVGGLALLVIGVCVLGSIVVKQIHLFENGIIIEKGQLQVFPWSQSEISQHIYRHLYKRRYRTIYYYTLRREDGYRIKLGNRTRNIAELGQAMTHGITRERYPRAIQSINAGQTISFGRFLSLNNQGITGRGEFLPWQQVQNVEIVSAFVSIKKIEPKWWEGDIILPFHEIPNAFVFVAVAQEMLRQTRGKDAGE